MDPPSPATAGLRHGRLRMNANRVGAEDMDRVCAWLLRKTFELSADYTDYADFGFGPSRAAAQKEAES